MNIANHKLEETAEDGVWLTFDGSEFLVACSKSRAFQKSIAKKSRKLNQAEAKRDPSLFLDVTAEAMAETVLLNWRGVRNGEEEFPCTPANKRIMLSLPEFRDWLTEASQDLENFRKEANAEDAEAIKSGS